MVRLRMNGIMSKFQIDCEHWFWTGKVIDLDLTIIFLVNIEMKAQGICCYLHEQVNNICVIVPACEEIDDIRYKCVPQSRF